ncbi:MAG TPA: MBL fold metallo-hydrolase [Chloroflexota bacterium]
MLRLIYLGTGAALPGGDRDNTSLALDDGHELTLIDASGSPFRRLVAAGLPIERLARLVLTHEHVDHVYGLPSLLQSLRLAGRSEPLPVFALPETWRVIEPLLAVFRARHPDEPSQIERHEIVPGDRPFVETEGLTSRAGLVEHSVPSIGLRIEHVNGAIAYSGDTAPCEAVVALAWGCSLLIHEATFFQRDAEGAARAKHSTAQQAGAIATQAGAERLALVHFTPTQADDLDVLRAEAAVPFAGPISVPADLDYFELG